MQHPGLQHGAWPYYSRRWSQIWPYGTVYKTDRLRCHRERPEDRHHYIRYSPFQSPTLTFFQFTPVVIHLSTPRQPATSPSFLTPAVHHPHTLLQPTTLSFFHPTQVVNHGSLQHPEHGVIQGRLPVHAQHVFQHQTLALDTFLACQALVQD
jgi:hypothetical protein